MEERYPNAVVPFTDDAYYRAWQVGRPMDDVIRVSGDVGFHEDGPAP
jgi:hypothetical protein